MTDKSVNQIGSEKIKHKGNVTRTITTSQVANEFIVNLAKSYEVDIGYIPAGFEHRPDLISELFYDTPSYEWLIMMMNNIDDPYESLNVGDRILIPKLA
jgi:hypothetical protein